MRGTNGFTLIELMITVAVIAIIAAIAYPSYQDQVRKSHRAEAKSELMQIAQNLERCYTANMSYISCDAGGGVAFPKTTQNGRYVISINSPRTANTYTLTAAPQGPQVKDTKCANFTLTETGAKGITGTSTVQNCW
jgi:type IV pilus assembly protein PilE